MALTVHSTERMPITRRVQERLLGMGFAPLAAPARLPPRRREPRWWIWKSAPRPTSRLSARSTLSSTLADMLGSPGKRPKRPHVPGRAVRCLRYQAAPSACKHDGRGRRAIAAAVERNAISGPPASPGPSCTLDTICKRDRSETDER